jgi:hypothetical protein
MSVTLECRAYFDYMYYLYITGDSDDYNCNEIYLYNQWIKQRTMFVSSAIVHCPQLHSYLFLVDGIIELGLFLASIVMRFLFSRRWT